MFGQKQQLFNWRHFITEDFLKKNYHQQCYSITNKNIIREARGSLGPKFCGEQLAVFSLSTFFPTDITFPTIPHL